MKKILLMALCAIATLASCGGDDEENTSSTNEKEQLEQLIIGYWDSFSQNSGTVSYSFVSFSKDGDYALYIGDDLFSSGTYSVKDNVVSLSDGYNGTATSITATVSDEDLSISAGGVTYKGVKTTKSPIDLDYVFIGKSYTSYFFMKPTPITFNTRYAATQEYQYTTTKKLYIYWQYVYDGNKHIFAKKYNDPNVHTLVGGYNRILPRHFQISSNSTKSGACHPDKRRFCSMCVLFGSSYLK